MADHDLATIAEGDELSTMGTREQSREHSLLEGKKLSGKEEMAASQNDSLSEDKDQETVEEQADQPGTIGAAEAAETEQTAKQQSEPSPPDEQQTVASGEGDNQDQVSSERHADDAEPDGTHETEAETAGDRQSEAVDEKQIALESIEEDEKVEAETDHEPADEKLIDEKAADGGRSASEDGTQEPDGDRKTSEPDTSEAPATTETEEVEKPAEQPMPSDDFATGERPESVVRIGERLSREPTDDELRRLASEDQQEQAAAGFEQPEPTSPTLQLSGRDRVGPTDGAATDNQSATATGTTAVIDKQGLIERYQEVLVEREKLQQKNLQLQHKLAEYFRKKKPDDRLEPDKSNQEHEQRYLKYIQTLEKLKQELEAEKLAYAAKLDQLRVQREQKIRQVKAARDRLVSQRRQIVDQAINTRTGRPIQARELEAVEQKDDGKERELVQVRLEFVKLRNKLKKREQQLKNREELAEGLHLIEFEQLKIENQTYNEKIEERNEDLAKLRRKITSTVQVLTHLKEKVEFVQSEKEILREKLDQFETQTASKRDQLTRTKQVRDALRHHNQRLKERCGMMTSKTLLRDYEEVVDSVDALKSRLEQLKLMHADFSLNSSSFKKKIDRIRTAES